MAENRQSDVFEIFGTYFANCFWNHLYTQALDTWHNEGHETLDESYRTVITRYNTAFCKKTDKKEKLNKHYVAIVGDLFKNYKEYLLVSDTHMGFIDNVVKLFIPSHFYGKMPVRDERKENIFRDVMSKTLTKFTMFISQEGIEKVLDPNMRKLENAKGTVIQWKKKYIEILQQERNNLCGLLLAKNSGVDIRDPDEIPSMPKQVCDKLSEKIKLLIEEKNKMTNERNQYARLAMTYKDMLQRQEVEIANKIHWTPRGARTQIPVAPPVFPMTTEVSEQLEVVGESEDEESPANYEFSDEPILETDEV
jgi:hypothetical protein